MTSIEITEKKYHYLLTKPLSVAVKHTHCSIYNLRDILIDSYVNPRSRVKAIATFSCLGKLTSLANSRACPWRRRGSCGSFRGFSRGEGCRLAARIPPWFISSETNVETRSYQNRNFTYLEPTKSIMRQTCAKSTSSTESVNTGNGNKTRYSIVLLNLVR